MKDFDEARKLREAQERLFVIGGHEFSYRPAVAPEMIVRWSDYAEGSETATSSEWLETIDETVLAIIEPEHHEAWRNVRDPDAPHPLNLSDLQELLSYLIEQVVGRPTGQPSESSGGPAETATASTDGSSSPAEPESTPSTSGSS